MRTRTYRCKTLLNVSPNPTARCQTSKTLRAERGVENSCTAFTVSPLRLDANPLGLLHEKTCPSREKCCGAPQITVLPLTRARTPDSRWSRAQLTLHHTKTR